VNLSACLAAAEKRVILIDLDPQGNATTGVGIDKHAVEFSSFDFLLDDTRSARPFCPPRYPG